LLLWGTPGKLMGTAVLPTKAVGTRAYAHCSQQYSGGVALLLLNLNSSSVTVSLAGVSQPSGAREEYHLTGPSLDGPMMALNEQLLMLSPSGQLPPLTPVTVPTTAPLTLAAQSLAFVVLPQAGLEACGHSV
jgi:hypothetical protein